MLLTDEKYKELYGLVIDALYPLSAAGTLQTYCDRLNMPLTKLDAFTSKRKYVDSRLMGITSAQLIDIANRIKRDYSNVELMNFFKNLNETKESITEITRKDILDALRLGNMWYSGECSELDFFKRVFNLDDIPSNDSRFKTFEGDYIQHTVNNYDWDDYCFFSDSRFDLLHTSDDIFTKFLCETLHPIIRPKQEDVKNLLEMYNKHLQNDGWEIYVYTKISGKPIFRARKIGVGVEIREITFGEEYIRQQIRRMEENIENSPDLAIGTAKELIETMLKTLTNTTNRKADIPTLQKQALKSLNLLPENIPDSAKGVDIIKVLLSNLSTIVQKMDELRNLYGTGHGKNARYRGLEPRHAKLAVDAAKTFVDFVFSTYQKKNRNSHQENNRNN